MRTTFSLNHLKTLKVKALRQMRRYRIVACKEFQATSGTAASTQAFNTALRVRRPTYWRSHKDPQTALDCGPAWQLDPPAPTFWRFTSFRIGTLRQPRDGP